MDSFRAWLLVEDIASNIAWTQNVLKSQAKVSPEAVQLISQALQSRKTDKKSYISYLFGYATIKPNARVEDFQKAIDNYNHYERTKQNQEMQQFRQVQPFELGKLDDQIERFRNNPQSNTQIKKNAKQQVSVDERRLKTEQFGNYVFYTIPKATNEQEEVQNKMMYCKYGKDSKWCTASPSGTSYKNYVSELDITIIMKNNAPLYQFGLKDGNINSNLVQFKDNEDEDITSVPKDLYEVLLNSPHRAVLGMPQFGSLPKIAKMNLKNIDARNFEYNIIDDIAVFYGLNETHTEQLKDKFINGLMQLDIKSLSQKIAPGFEFVEEGERCVVGEFDSLEELMKYLANTNSKVKDLKGFEDNYYDIDVHIEDKDIKDAFEGLSNELVELIEKRVNEEKPKDVDDETWKEMDLYDAVVEYHPEILDAIRSAIYAGYQAGTESKRYENMTKQLRSGDYNGFYVDFSQGVKLAIDRQDLYKFYHDLIERNRKKDNLGEIFQEGIDMNDFIELEYRDTSDYGFDDDAFEEALKEEL